MAEIRLWFPESLSALKYMLRNPKSFVIGTYTYNRFLKQRDVILDYQRKHIKLTEEMNAMRTKLIDSNKELSALKRKLTVDSHGAKTDCKS